MEEGKRAMLPSYLSRDFLCVLNSCPKSCTEHVGTLFSGVHAQSFSTHFLLTGSSELWCRFCNFLLGRMYIVPTISHTMHTRRLLLTKNSVAFGLSLQDLSAQHFGKDASVFFVPSFLNSVSSLLFYFLVFIYYASGTI